MSNSNRSLRCVVCVAGLQRSAGGFSRSVPQLCDAVARQNVATKLVTAIQRREELLLPSSQVELIGVANASFGNGVLRAVESAATVPDGARAIIHDNGIWLPFHHNVARAAMRNRIPFLVSPRGTLTPWALHYRRLKKQLAWLLYQRRNLAAATAFHATSEMEADDIRSLGFAQPIAVIANGVDFPEGSPSRDVANGTRTMLFLSRIHPKKGLANLLQAWRLASPGPEWRLVIAGPDEGGHRETIERLTMTLGLTEAVDFPGDIGEGEKWNWYAAADVFVLPSFSENFGRVIAEALVSGRPVITTTATPWAELSQHRFGWWVEPRVEALTAAIREATSMPRERLREMGQRAAPWARVRFSWDTVAVRMTELYGWLTHGGNAPEFVQEVDRQRLSPRHLLGRPVAMR